MKKCDNRGEGAKSGSTFKPNQGGDGGIENNKYRSSQDNRSAGAEICNAGNTSPSLTRDNIIDKMKNGDSVNMVSPLSKASIPTNEVSRNTENAKGMPTNCKDLQLLGHQLSGFYSVKTQLKHQTAKIETVYCKFQASSNSKGSIFYRIQLASFSSFNSIFYEFYGFETRTDGVVDIKSSQVHPSV